MVLNCNMFGFTNTSCFSDFELPVGIRLLTIFLEEKQHEMVMKYHSSSNRHNQTSKFVWAGSENAAVGKTGSSHHMR